MEAHEKRFGTVRERVVERADVACGEREQSKRPRPWPLHEPAHDEPADEEHAEEHARGDAGRIVRLVPHAEGGRAKEEGKAEEEEEWQPPDKAPACAHLNLLRARRRERAHRDAARAVRRETLPMRERRAGRRGNGEAEKGAQQRQARIILRRVEFEERGVGARCEVELRAVPRKADVEQRRTRIADARDERLAAALVNGGREREQLLLARA
mmetsp:Transcript_12624/g.39739  ORF Transcript_12624/g.39739 Transcript_12624/m.39739 type:complete len:212 (+) Transcript_12624:574-1209(+)